MPGKKEEFVPGVEPAVDVPETPMVQESAPVAAPAAVAAARKHGWMLPVAIALAALLALGVGGRIAFGAARLLLGGGRGFGPGAMMGRNFDGGGGQGYGRGGMMGRGWQNDRGGYGYGQGPGADADGLCPYCGRGDGAGAQPGQPNQRGRMGPGRRGWQGVPPQSQESTGASQSSNGTF
jgi:hypothetical protein